MKKTPRGYSKTMYMTSKVTKFSLTSSLFIKKVEIFSFYWKSGDFRFFLISWSICPQNKHHVKMTWYLIEKNMESLFLSHVFLKVLCAPIRGLKRRPKNTPIRYSGHGKNAHNFLTIFFRSTWFSWTMSHSLEANRNSWHQHFDYCVSILARDISENCFVPR